jgi:hypothetical protein
MTMTTDEKRKMKTKKTTKKRREKTRRTTTMTVKETCSSPSYPDHPGCTVQIICI